LSTIFYDPLVIDISVPFYHEMWVVWLVGMRESMGVCYAV